MKVAAHSSSDPTAAVATAGRELLTGVLQRNPIVAVATALLSPILSLFQSRRPAPSCRPCGTEAHSAQIEKLKVEHYRSGPFAPPAQARQQGSSKDQARIQQGRSQRPASRQPALSQRAASRCGGRVAVTAQEGGIHHG